mgnify:CR=1 FL=1
MRNNIVQGSDSSEAEVFDLIKRIEKGLEKFGTNHRLILGGESYLTERMIRRCCNTGTRRRAV